MSLGLSEILNRFEPSRRPNIKETSLSRPRTLIPTRKFCADPIAESFIEAQLYTLAELQGWITELVVQPFTIRIMDALGTNLYTPDALICADGAWKVVECKGVRDLFDEGVVSLLRRAENAVGSEGLDLVVIDEIDVGGWALQDNLSQLWRVHRAIELEKESVRLGEMTSASGLLTIGEALSSGFHMFHIYKAIADGLIYADLQREMAVDTILRSQDFSDPRAILWKLRKRKNFAYAAAADDIAGVSI